jgi:membrane protease YdiL (CAAX protease family)
MKPPFSTHWNQLTVKQAWIFIIVAFVLEIPIRWLVRPGMQDLILGNFWLNLPLRLVIETLMIAVFIVTPLMLGASLKTVGIPLRRWTRWEWTAFTIIGTVILIIVVSIAGSRWPRIWTAGLIGEGLLWVFSEFMFGFNQETGFRGIMMSGLLRLKGWKFAFTINTLFFLIGPLHGPGMLEWLISNPLIAGGYIAGVIANGLGFSWIRYRTDNVILVAVLHGMINCFLNGSALVLRANGLS